MMPVALLTWAAAVAGMGWIMVGYPALVLWLGARRARPVRRDDSYRPSVTVLLVVRDGAPWLERKLACLTAQTYPKALLDLVVVSDGSTDATEAIVERALADGRVQQLIRTPAVGKAGAIAAALSQLRGEVIVMTDVRQPVAPDAIAHLVAPLADPTVAVVSGQLRQMNREGVPIDAGAYWRLEVRMREAFGHHDSMIGATGALYAIRRTELRAPPTGLILDDVYLPMQPVLRGRRVVMAPEAAVWEEPVDAAQEFRRKVRTAAGNYQLLRSEPRLLSPQANRLLFHYLNYKVARLLLPHLLLVQGVAAIFLPPSLRGVVLAMNAGALLLAGIAPQLAGQSWLARPAAILRSLYAMMAAAFVGQRIFFSGTAGLWVPTVQRTQAGVSMTARHEDAA